MKAGDVTDEGGTGVPPVRAHKGETPTSKARPRLRDIPHTTEDGIEIRRGANLPHWRRGDAAYAVTFRLADSLPRGAVARFARERESAREIKDEAQRRIRIGEIADREEAELARGAGSCLLANPEARSIVANALRHFAGTRYALFAYVVMPNHVHVLLRPIAPSTLSGVLHSWKSYTAKRLVTAGGRVWQSEAYDHLVQGDEDYATQLRYILLNPERANLESGYELFIAPNADDLWFGNPSEAEHGGTGVSPVMPPSTDETLAEGVGFEHRRDADATFHASDEVKR